MSKIDREAFERIVVRMANQVPTRYYMYPDGTMECPFVILEITAEHPGHADVVLKPLGFSEGEFDAERRVWRWRAEKGAGFGMSPR